MNTINSKWSGRTAVVTGASSGIGAAIAVALANAGLRVVGLARRAILVEDLQSRVSPGAGGSITARGCDVADPAAIADAFRFVDEQFGGTDLLVNNAAVFPSGHVTDAGTHTLSEAELISEIDINFKGLVLCTRHAVNSMKKRCFDGHVVNICSIAGHYIPFSHHFNIYPATKHAVAAFGHSLNNELIHFGSNVKITNLSPGLVLTDMAKEARGAEGTDFSEVPALKPEDIADAVLYVISTPRHVNITELTVEPVRSARL